MQQSVPLMTESSTDLRVHVAAGLNMSLSTHSFRQPDGTVTIVVTAAEDQQN